MKASENVIPFAPLMRLRKISSKPLLYQAIELPPKMGNGMPIAFGGFVVAICIQACFHSLLEDSKSSLPPNSWALYSCLGNFLGPTLLGKPLMTEVKAVRQTRSFATRHVVAWQEPKEGQRRETFSMTVDFIRRVQPSVPQKGSKFPIQYSIPPTKSYPPPEEVPHITKRLEDRVEKGELPVGTVAAFESNFSVGTGVSELRIMPNTDYEEKAIGFLKERKGPQDHLPPTSRVQADWMKPKVSITSADALNKVVAESTVECLPLDPYAIQISYLSFILDMGLTFFPLINNGLFIQDSSACSSLDMAIRFLVDDLDCDQYHLRELQALGAANEMSYNECRIWNHKGQLVAVTNQQGVVRPPKVKL